MKSTIWTFAIVLGFISTGFSQTYIKGIAHSNTNTPVYGADSESTPSNVVKPFVIGVTLFDSGISYQVEVTVENPNVSINPGETVIIKNDGTDKLIAVKNNGEYLGLVYSHGRSWSDAHR